METGLRGRTAVIAGGSVGIGKASAKGLAAEGVNLVLLARGPENLEKAASEITSASRVEVLTIPTDLKDAQAVNAAAAAAAKRFGTIHILVNTMGNRMRKPGRQILWEDEEWLDDVNSKSIAMLRAIRAFLPHFAKDGSGRIINIAGSAGMTAWEGALTHGFNNSAMMHTTTYLAHDLANDHITVNAVVPGLVGTEWREGWADMRAGQQGKSRAEFLADYCQQKGILAGRWAEMSEVADSVVFLASDRARYINGTRLIVDGGLSVNPR
ncbi:MAG TPA: SDR family oxidoreductase [Ktedonobacterales bacterium]|jgi:NAD(P)-dependent dehydrogenase (short-subunit alcohol dehydrogenase family)